MDERSGARDVSDMQAGRQEEMRWFIAYVVFVIVMTGAGCALVSHIILH